MTHYSHDDLMALAGAYAVGATTPEEAGAVESAMPSSPELAAEVLSYQKVTVDLLAAQRGVTPSLSTRERLLETIRSEAIVDAPVPVIRRVMASRWRSMIPLGAAASLLAAAALGIQVKRMQNEMGRVSARLAHREATLNSFLHAEKDLRIVHLKAADTVAGPGIQLFWDARHATGVVHAFRLPPAPSGRAYQVWAIIDNKPVSVRVFDSDPDGHALVEGVMLPSNAGSVSRILVTVEPRAGSVAPTSVPFLGSSVLGSE